MKVEVIKPISVKVEGSWKDLKEGETVELPDKFKYLVKQKYLKPAKSKKSDKVEK